MGCILQDAEKRSFQLCYTRQLVSWAIVLCSNYPGNTVSEIEHDEPWIGKDLEGYYGGLIGAKFGHFSARTKENHEKIQSLQPVLQSKL
jgi:hypothetical protein